MKKINKAMIRSKLLIIPIMIFGLITLFSCQKRTDDIFIGKNSKIKITSEYGEILLKFKEESMKIEKIEINDFKNDSQLTYETNDLNLIKTKTIKNQEKSQDQNYLSFRTDPEIRMLNDSLELEITQQLMTNHIIRNKESLYYLATYENGVKVYNSLNLKVIDAMIDSQNELKLLLKNNFQFNGHFNFYYYRTKTKLQVEKTGINEYSVVYGRIDPEESVIMIDIEVVPTLNDTLINSTFTQRINIKQ
jgi:hypothetical protein